MDAEAGVRRLPASEEGGCLGEGQVGESRVVAGADVATQDGHHSPLSITKSSAVRWKARSFDAGTDLPR